MTSTFQALYSHTLEGPYLALVKAPDYHHIGQRFDTLLDMLHSELPPAQSAALDALLDCLFRQRDIELSAMFQAAWTVARELQSSTCTAAPSTPSPM